MTQQTDITSADFFRNAAAQEAGLSGQFWLDVYNGYLEAMRNELYSSPGAWEVERTVRVLFEGSHVDVLVREQPEGREHSVLRFTAFPAGNGSEPREFDRWYFYGDGGNEIPPVLGEAALLDHSNRW